MAFLPVHPDWQIETNRRLDLRTLSLVKTSRRHFTCERTDPSNDTPIRALEQHIFPREGDADPDDLTMRCTNSQVKPLGLTALECFADYESLPDTDPGGGPNSPQQILAGWDYEFDSEESEEPIDVARDVHPRNGRDTSKITSGVGVAITTITGESYDPPLTDIASDIAFTFSTTNVPFRPDIVWLYRNCVNSDTFLGLFDAGTCRMRQCRGSMGTSTDGSRRWNLSVRVVIRNPSPGSIPYRAWWRRVRAEGFYINVQTDGGLQVTKRATDSEGEMAVKPVLHRTTPDSGMVFVGLGEQITDPKKAEFYEFQPPSVRYLPFNVFFQSVVAGR